MRVQEWGKRIYEVEQWFPELDLEGVKVYPPEVLFNMEEDFFRIRVPGRKSPYWMSRRRVPGSPPKTLEEGSSRGAYLGTEFMGWGETENFYREILPVHSLGTWRREDLPPDLHRWRPGEDPEAIDVYAIQDYGQACGWPTEKGRVVIVPQAGEVTTPNGPVPIQPGEYLLTDDEGNHHVATEAEIREDYEEIP